MTARNLYEGVLIELNKENAPNILLEDFNYFANKAINNYINKRYNIYDINQQTTDDLRVLKATAMLKPRQITDYKGLTMAGKDKMATYEVIMPSDYLHILNCICIYKVNKTYSCYNKGDYWRSSATRLTADMYSLVLDNFWNKPTYKRPYYYIHNVNTSVDIANSSDPDAIITYAPVPTNPYGGNSINTTVISQTNTKVVDNSNLVKDSLNKVIGGYKIEYEYDSSVDENGYVKRTITYMKAADPLDTAGAVDDTIEPIIDYVKKSTNSTIGNSNTGTDVNRVETRGTYHNNPGSGTGNSLNYDYGTDGANHQIVQGKGLPDTISVNINGAVTEASNRERGQGIRYGNVSLVRLEIRYGTDTSVFLLSDVYVDYIKAPQNIRLTQEEIDLTEDTSQMLEYPDYVCQEIINELVHLIMENISDQRLQTHPVVSLSIANPAQALAPQAQGLAAQ